MSPTSTSDCLLEDHLKQAACTSKQDQQRYCQEGKRVDKEIKRWRDETDRLEQQRKRLRTNENEARRLHQSLKFEALCLALRRNDPSMTKLPLSDDFPPGFAQALGHALDGNTHVSTMEIDIERSFPRDDVRPFDEDYRYMKKHFDSLAKFLRTSTSLRVVDNFCLLHDNELGRYLERKLIRACFQNRYIEELGIHNARLPRMTIFENCRLSTSLKVLQLDLWLGTTYSAHERRVIQDAVQSFSSLTTIFIHTSDCALARSILAGIQAAGCNLEQLAVYSGEGEGTGDLWSAISRLVRNSTQLSKLCLQSYTFTGWNMETLIRCLKLQSGSTVVVSLESLDFYDCVFDRDAKRLLCEFLHTRVGLQSDGGTVVTSSLTELKMRYQNNCNDFSAQALVSILSEQQEIQPDEGPKWCQTIGSQVHSLSLEPVDECFVQFLAHLASNSQRTSLTSLAVNTVWEQDTVATFATCIAKIESLRTLTIEAHHVSALPVLVSLRENGSITSTSLDAHISPEISSKLAKAYAERNLFLDDLLLATTSLDVGDCIERRKELSLCSALLEVAKQIPTRRATSLLRSLLLLRDSVGVA